MRLNPLWAGTSKKPTFPASHQLNEVSMSIQLRLFLRIITLSWLQTNPSLGCFSGWTLCSLFSWSVGLLRRAHKMEAIVWNCQNCCKCDPFKVKHMQPSIMLWYMAPIPARSFGFNPSIPLLREKMGEETVIKDCSSFAGIKSNSSKLKLRNVTCNLSHAESCLVPPKAFLFLLLILRFCPWGIYF